MPNQNLIEECILLEKELSQYKLWGNLVPKKSFYSNLRKVLCKEEWDILRKEVYKKDKYKCVICGEEETQLEAHELWRYDYENAIQRLGNIVSLCHLCHLNNHLRFAKVQIKMKKIERESLINHWCRVNQEQKENFDAYELKVNKLWKLRNKFEWNIIDPYGNFILDGANLDTLLKFIASKQLGSM